jgi:hypothetical protein
VDTIMGDAVVGEGGGIAATRIMGVCAHL